MWRQFNLFFFTLSKSLILTQVNTDEKICECVPYYLCDDNNTIITDGRDIIDIRISVNECSSYLDVCCNVKDQLTKPKPRNLEKIEGCGYRNVKGVGFRISGNTDNEAEFGEFPWTLALMSQNELSNKFSYLCGGSLIHPQVVLTAAHCILINGKLQKKVIVRAGEWDPQTTNELLRHEERRVVSAVLHKDYNRADLRFDVALLFLESHFNRTQHINTVCLPTEDTSRFSDNCFVTGWGKENFEKDGIYQNILKKIEVSIVDRFQCERAFKKTRLGNSFSLHRSFICAGGNEEDACTGDGGGPLVCPIEGQSNRYQQVGIVSWGIGCSTKGIPGAYIDVGYVRNWIEQQMEKHNFKTNYNL